MVDGHRKISEILEENKRLKSFGNVEWYKIRVDDLEKQVRLAQKARDISTLNSSKVFDALEIANKRIKDLSAQLKVYKDKELGNAIEDSEEK